MKLYRTHLLAVMALAVAILVRCIGGTEPAEDVRVHANAVGTTYWVDPVHGDDANDGTSNVTAKKTIQGMQAVPLRGGDVVNLRGTGHHPSSLFMSNRWGGAADNPIIVRSAPGEKAVFDPGIDDFKTKFQDQWEPCSPSTCVWKQPEGTPPIGMPPHPDEYVSKSDQFPVNTSHGTFLGSGDRLLRYERVEDLRADNESIALVADSDPRPGVPIWGDAAARKYVWTYRGPGLWWNPVTKRIHFRASPTHFNQPGIVDYAGEKDPRKLPLSISPDERFAAIIRAHHLRFENIVFQNGSTGATVHIPSDVEHVTFDHCAFHAARSGMYLVGRTRFVKIQHCVFDSHVPSYVSRSDTKDHWDLAIGTFRIDHKGTNGTSEMQFVTTGQSEDLEIANCEFRNAHDAVQLYDVRTKIHHSLFENINDEVFSFQWKNSTDVEVYNNVIRKALSVFSFAQEGAVPGRARIYRNILDNRIPTLGFRHMPPDVPPPGETSFWRVGVDFKMNAPVDEFYFYQNTIIQGPPGYPQQSSIFDECDAGNPKIRRFVNNIHMSIDSDKPLHAIPDPAFPALSDGNDWFRRINEPQSPLYIGPRDAGGPFADYPALADSGLWARFKAANGVGWDTHSQFGNPRFVDVSEHVHAISVPYTNADYRLEDASPARGAGVDLTGWPDSVGPDSTPDIGALPFGAEPVKVGVDSRHVFPDGATPIAEAGDYSVVPDTNDDGSETVSLDSAGSSHPLGSPLTYAWSVSGHALGTLATASVDFPVGDHHVLLTVTDDTGKRATDMRQITVRGFDNLVRNPSFERGAADWNFAQPSSTVVGAPHFGSRALEIPGLAGANAIVTQRVPVTPGGDVMVSGWMHGTGFTGALQSKIAFQWLDANHASLGSVDVGQSGNAPYAIRSQRAIAPPAAVSAEIALSVPQGSQPGKAHFDDLHVGIIDNEVQNAHFERGLTGWVVDGAASLSNVSRSGSGAMRLQGDAAAHRAGQFIPVTLNETYAISGWIRAEGLDPTKGAEVLVLWATEKNEIIREAWAGRVCGTTGYVHVAKALVPTREIDPRIAKIQLLVRIEAGNTNGAAYFDDLYVSQHDGGYRGAPESNPCPRP